MSSKPIIGFTLDFEEQGDYAPLPYYAIRKNYADAISFAGGVPVALPYDVDAVDQYFDLIDGIVVTGGDFDIHPSMYGSEEVHEKVTTKSLRTEFEVALLKKMLASKKPILGICAGEQLINVLLGGDMIQHIPDEIENALEHEQKNPRTETSHSIKIKEGTKLYSIVGGNHMEVNSSHHQAVKNVGKDVIISAVAPDGVVEAIEYDKHPFCIGVEWHPEYLIENGDKAIYKALIEEANRAK